MIYYLKIQNYIKVGFSDNVETRMKQYNSCLPIDAELLAVTQGNKDDEKKIHNTLNKYLHKREWFKDCKEIRDHISELETIDHFEFDSKEEYLTPSDIKVLIEMYKLLNENGDVLIPPRVRDEISKRAEIHTTNISKSFGRLKRLGYIQGDRGCFNILKMVPIPIELH